MPSSLLKISNYKKIRGRLFAAATGIFFGWGIGVGLQAVSEELVSTSVGIVNKEVMTSREVYARFLMDIALSDPSQLQKSSFRLPAVESPRFGDLLSQNLTEWMVFFESLGFSSMQVSNAQVVSQYDKAERVLSSFAIWLSLKIEPSEAKELLKRYLQANKFIQYRVSSAQIPIADEEALRFYQENQSQYGAIPFADSEASIRSVLVQKQKEKRLKDWVSMLQSKYGMRNLLAEQ